MPHLYTVAQAAAAYKANHAVSTMAVGDTVSDILANLSTLSSLVSAHKVGGVAISDTEVISSYQAVELYALPNVSGALIIEDSAANLLNPSRFAAIQWLGTSVILTGANVVTAAQAAKLAAFNFFSLASGATMVVSDTATNLLLTANAAGVAAGSSVVLSGDSTVTAAQATALAAVTGFRKGTGAVLHVVDTLANLMSPGNAAGLALANYTLLSTDTTVSASQLVSLAGLKGFGEVAGTSVTVHDSAADLVADAATIARYSNNTVLTGTNAITASEATTLLGFHNMSLGYGASLSITDTGSAYAAFKAAALAAKAGFALPTSYTATVSAATAAQASGLQADTNVGSFAVADTGADLTGSLLDQLASDSKLSGITVTSGTIQVAYPWYTQIGAALGKLAAGYTLDVLDAPVSAISTLQSDTRVTGFTVSDTWGNLNGAAGEISSASKVISSSYSAQLTYDPGDLPIYSQITGDDFYIANTPAAAVASINAVSSIEQEIEVVDTAENITPTSTN